jgi:anti-anti-sigma factor
VPAAPLGEKRHRVDLVLRSTSAQVRLAGDIDLVAAADLRRALESLDRLATSAIEVDLTEVRFLDTAGLEPLMEATRRRRAQRLPPVLIGQCSPAALRLLAAAGLDPKPVLDVEAWDQLSVLLPQSRCGFGLHLAGTDHLPDTDGGPHESSDLAR